MFKPSPTPPDSASDDGKPVPPVYGGARVAENVIWYDDFVASQNKEPPPATTHYSYGLNRALPFAENSPHRVRYASKLAAALAKLAADLGSIWLIVSMLAGIGAGAFAAAFVYLAPAIAIAWLIVKMVAAL